MSERVSGWIALLVCAVGAVVPFAAQESRSAQAPMTRLEKLGRDALAIVVVKLDQPFRATRQSAGRARSEKDAVLESAQARCVVARVLYGHAELSNTTLRANVRGAQVPELLSLRKGESLVVFLADDPIAGMPESTRRDLHELPVSVLAEGAWAIERVASTERLIAPSAALPLPETLARSPDASLLMTTATEWLDTLTARTTPSVRMVAASTGLPDRRRLDHDGFFESWVAPKEGRLGAEKLESFFTRWNALHVDELPDSFGTSLTPDEPMYVITVKGRTSARTIRFQTHEAPNLPFAIERDRIARGVAAIELLRTL